ncbi:MAG: phosphoadenosine phosphosulfate reductase family protein, partial [Planctomycetes bacterium]|nr:phosphoadenosine phosphosulfate reductase family protein [Planctomycetota bacterium]
MNLDVQKQNFDFLEGQTRALVRWGQETFGAKVFLTSAFGINGSVLLELVRPILPDVEIFFIDTGCHFAETLELRDHFRQKGFNVVEIGSEPRGNGRDFEEIGHDLC